MEDLKIVVLGILSMLGTIPLIGMVLFFYYLLFQLVN